MTPTAHPRLPGELWRPGEPLHDVPQHWEVQASTRPYESGYVSLRVDTLPSDDGSEFERAVVEHPGAVGVVALDDAGRVLLLRQYRHAVEQRLLQIPAGLRDVEGEPPVETASRELAEEGQVRAARWQELLTLLPSPGLTDERWVVYLAEDLAPAPHPEGFVPEHEEAAMSVVWVPLEEAVRAVFDGRLTDTMAAASLLAVRTIRNLRSDHP
ncbi:MAG TPA: NUDIX hydrolase [Nocardioidaceae bacterium]|nr:NUDIX hydrolase [Nocardioidaceae bacterium]